MIHAVDVLLLLSTVYVLPGRILLTCFLLQLAAHEWSIGLPSCLANAVGSAFALRVGLVGATLVHEWAHILAGTRHFPLDQLFNTANVWANLEPSVWLRCLNPFAPLQRSFQPHVKLPAKLPSCQGDEAITGWAASLCLCLVLTICAPGAWGAWMSVGSWVCLAGATATDLAGWRTPEHSHTTDSTSARWQYHFCGNFGLLVAQGVDDLRTHTLDALAVLEAMADVSSERGGQSGGLVTLTGSPAGVRVRLCPSKRQSLSAQLAKKFRTHMRIVQLCSRIRALFGSQHGPNQDVPPGTHSFPHIYVGHTRFATSSIPTAGETHPHRWSPPQPQERWGVQSNGQIRMERVTHALYVTHNGDFEFYNLWGRDRTHSEVGLWLSLVLSHPRPATCDSVAIAGLMELLRTEGMWGPALRLAFQQSVVESFEEVTAPAPHAPTANPSPAVFQALGHVADTVFGTFLETFHPNSDGTSPISLRSAFLPESRRELQVALSEAFRTQGSLAIGRRSRVSFEHTLLTAMPSDVLDNWVAQSVRSFLEMDLFAAVQHFLTHAKGSFGMCATCTLDPTRVVLSALNQPLAIGFAPHQESVLYSSESHALKVLLPTAGGGGGHATLRLDLNEGEGEVAEVRMRGKGEVGGGGGGGGRSGDGFV